MKTLKCLFLFILMLCSNLKANDSKNLGQIDIQIRNAIKNHDNKALETLLPPIMAAGLINIESQDRGLTYVLEALDSNNAQALKMLRKAGADPNAGTVKFITGKQKDRTPAEMFVELYMKRPGMSLDALRALMDFRNFRYGGIVSSRIGNLLYSIKDDYLTYETDKSIAEELEAERLTRNREIVIIFEMISRGAPLTTQGQLSPHVTVMLFSDLISNIGFFYRPEGLDTILPNLTALEKIISEIPVLRAGNATQIRNFQRIMASLSAVKPEIRDALLEKLSANRRNRR